ncbi:MAG: hypothetical protein KY459_00310 [Acidobacteria bacterium]|nr:hypothetical protein [Acidobacteriota bacterium]
MVRDILIIAAREIRDKKILFLGAALCALIVLGTPLLPGASGESPTDVMTTAALTLFLVVMFATPAALGFGIIGRDLEEHRMAFYLARPVSTSSVWSGKTLGAVCITFGQAAIIVLIPTLLGKGLLSFGNYAATVGFESFLLSSFLSSPLRNSILASLLVLALAQFWALGLRSRSAWLLLDLAVFATVATIFWMSLRPFLLNGAEPDAVLFTSISLVMLGILLFAGSAAGLQLGRSDLHRTHRWTGIVTAALLLAGFLALGILSHQIRSLEPNELEYTSLIAAPREGPWIALEGARNREWNSYRASYLINTRTGRSVNIGNSNPSISRDGTIAAIWKRETLNPPVARLHWIDLKEPDELNHTDVSIPLEARDDWRFVLWPSLAISPAGGRVAWLDRGTVQAWDLRSATSLFSARLPDEDARPRVLFDGEDDLYVFSRPAGDTEGQWTIRKIDFEEKSWAITGTMPDGWFGHVEAGAPLRFTRRPADDDMEGPRVHELRDIEDGSVISSFTARGRFLSDGRFVEMSGESGAALRILNREGELEKTIELPPEGTPVGAAQVRSQMLTVRLVPGRDYRNGKDYLVDLETSKVRQIDSALHVVHPASESEKDIIVSDGRSLFLLDLETMKTERIAGRG